MAGKLLFFLILAQASSLVSEEKHGSLGHPWTEPCFEPEKIKFTGLSQKVYSFNEKPAL